MADLEIAARDRIGRALRAAGDALQWLGLELHGLSGWWDAVTDTRKMRKEPHRG